MKIDKLTIGAVIPVAQYSNLQPSIELSEVGVAEGTEFAMDYIKELFAKYAEKGPLTAKDIITATGIKKSFNESGVEVNFEPISHTYTYQGKKLQGATDYIKKFYKEFNATGVAESLKDKWDLPAETIKEIWEESGKLTSAFGTLVHNALEFYHNHKEDGERISEAKGEEENYILPKHPILRDIVQGFVNIDKRKGKIVSEVLITNIAQGFCGHADAIEIIDLDKKICRVGDFKININSEDTDKNLRVLPPFEKLESNKLSKYQLQMSIYANMLQASGWQVEGLDVWVYESEWKHYQFEVLKVI